MLVCRLRALPQCRISKCVSDSYSGRMSEFRSRARMSLAQTVNIRAQALRSGCTLTKLRNPKFQFIQLEWNHLFLYDVFSYM